MFVSFGYSKLCKLFVTIAIGIIVLSSFSILIDSLKIKSEVWIHLIFPVNMGCCPKGILALSLNNRTVLFQVILLRKAVSVR